MSRFGSLMLMLMLICFKVTRVNSYSDSQYNYTKTSHYAVKRSGQMSFNNVPVDGSSKMADDLMEAIEPF